MRQINDEGRNKIKGWEALILYAYDDFDKGSKKIFIKPGMKVKGTLTIGWGHTGSNVTPGLEITSEQAEAFLSEDLAPAEWAVSTLVKVELTDNQFAALVSFTFNVGVTAFKNSTLLKKLNSGDYNSVPSELMKWTKSKGQQMTGLVNRRSAEAGLWAKGSYIQSAGSPVSKKPLALMTPQNVALATTFVSGGGSQLVTGDGPFQYAIAVVAVLAAVAAIGFFLYERYKS